MTNNEWMFILNKILVKQFKTFLYQSSGKKMNGKFMAFLLRGLPYISLFQRKF